MLFAVQAHVAFRNAARRDAVADNVAARLAGFDATLERYDPVKLGPTLSVTVRFATLAEADSFWADLQVALGTGINGPVTGSSIWRHDCRHDEGVGFCDVASRVDF